MVSRFRDRSDAGDKLADLLLGRDLTACCVIGMARGGVIVAAQAARRLHLPLDVVVVRKISSRQNPEFAVGAVAPSGVRVLDRCVATELGFSAGEIEDAFEQQGLEVEDRLRRYAPYRYPIDLTGKTVILVDDGLATGTSALAAARYLKQRVAKLVFAAPVCSAQGAEALSWEVDEIVTLLRPNSFYAVAQFYEDFSQVEDVEVQKTLLSAHSPHQ